jgi:hypothetical protein
VFYEYYIVMRLSRLVCLETKKSIKYRDVCLWKLVGALETIWRCIQVGEMKALWRWWWADLPNRLCFKVGQSMEGNEQVGGNGIAIEETHEGPANEDVIGEGCGEE